MRRWFFCFACVLVLGSSSASFGQEPSGPRTLENLLKSDDSEKSGAPAAADVTDAGPKRPEGTVSRPKDGVQHPDLDKAWADYEAAVAQATESVKAAIAKRFDAATAKGDLEAAEKWQATLEKYEKEGKLPAESETKVAVSAAIVAHKTAKEDLTAAYENAVKALTMEKKIPEAQAVRDELLSLERQDAARPEEVAVFLSDLQEQNVRVGYGVFGKGSDLGYDGKSHDGKSIVVAGQAVRKGLSMHPPSNGASAVTYDVPMGCTHFKAKTAMNDSAGLQKAPVVFCVSSGKRILWKGRPIQGAGAGEDCVVPLKGAKTVTLTVHCSGVHDYAHAVWVDPRFLKK